MEWTRKHINQRQLSWVEAHMGKMGFGEGKENYDENSDNENHSVYAPFTYSQFGS